MQIPGPIPKTVNQNWSGPKERVHKHRLLELLDQSCTNS